MADGAMTGPETTEMENRAETAMRAERVIML
jgi:hypothetical protein